MSIETELFFKDGFPKGELDFGFWLRQGNVFSCSINLEQGYMGYVGWEWQSLSSHKLLTKAAKSLSSTKCCVGESGSICRQAGPIIQSSRINLSPPLDTFVQ